MSPTASYSSSPDKRVSTGGNRTDTSIISFLRGVLMEDKVQVVDGAKGWKYWDALRYFILLSLGTSSYIITNMSFYAFGIPSSHCHQFPFSGSPSW